MLWFAPYTDMFEHLASSWWCYFERVWNLWDMKSSWWGRITKVGFYSYGLVLLWVSSLSPGSYHMKVHILTSTDVPASMLSPPRQTAHSEIYPPLSCFCCRVCYNKEESNECIDRGQTPLYLAFILPGNEFEEEMCWLHPNTAMLTLLISSLTWSFLLKSLYISTYKLSENYLCCPTKPSILQNPFLQKLQVLCTQWPSDKAMSGVSW